MKKNRKWLIALCSILLLTLIVGGGALAADGTKWIANKNPTTVNEVEPYPFRLDNYALSDDQDVIILGSAVGGGYFNSGTDMGGPLNFIRVRDANGSKEGYILYSQLKALPGSATTIKVYGGTNFYTYVPVKGMTSIPMSTVVTEYSSGGAAYDGYLRVRYDETNPNAIGYISKSDLTQQSTTSPTNPPNLGQLRTRSSGATYYEETSNGALNPRGQIAGNTTMQILGQKQFNGVTYYMVRYGNLDVWLSASEVTVGGGSGGGGGGSGRPSQRSAYIIGGSLALRSSANNANNSNIIRYYPDGTAVEILDTRNDGWSEIRIVADGAEGFVRTQFLSSRRGGSNDIGYGGGSGSGSGGSKQPTVATVNNPSSSGYVNLRRYADGNSEILGRFTNGQQVTILEYGAAWCRVQIGNLEGYMQTSLLKMGSGSGSSNPNPSPNNPTSAVVNNPNPTDRLNLRAQPSTGSTSLGRYYNGTAVKVYEYGATWCYVEVQGIRGYMMTSYLSFNGSYTPPSGGGSTGGGGSSGIMYAVVKNPVSTQKLNLRAQPTTGSTSLGQFYNGTAVTVTRYGAEWCEVTVNGIRGYMMTMYLSFSGSTPSTTAQYAVIKNPVASQFLNLRASADVYSRSLGQFYNGTTVKILEYGLEWCRVEVNGLRGYMVTRYLQIVK